MQEEPISLRDMAIGSVDTLRETETPQRIPPTWRDQPPLLVGPRNTPETPQLLKGLIRQGIPPPLRCAVWLSNVMQAVHPHQESSYWHEYRTLAKAQALGHAYEGLLQQMVPNETQQHDTMTRLERQEQTEALWMKLPAPHFGNKLPQATSTDDNATTTATATTTYPTIPGTTPTGALAQKRVLLALQRLLGFLEYAPAVPTLVGLLLTAQSESYAFCALREMSHAPSCFFAVTVAEQKAFPKAFADVLNKLHPQTAEYLDDRGVLDTMGEVLFANFFVEYLPLQYVLRLVDIFTLEGIKVLFRFGVALLVLFKKQSSEDCLTISNAKEWWMHFKEWTHSRHFCWNMVTRKAYGVHGRGGMRRQLRFPRRHILQRIIRMEEDRFLREEEQKRNQEGTSSISSSMTPSQPLGLAEPAAHDPFLSASCTTEPTPVHPVLAQSLQVRTHLAEWMPLPLRLTNLQLLYSTNHHGRSLEMLYNRVHHAKHTILLAEVLSSSQNAVVGLYAPQAWRPSPRVYGDGSCLLFRVSPEATCWKWKPKAASDDEDEDWQQEDTSNRTALLEQFMVSTAKYLSMGGNPDGSSGLRLNEDLTKGESSTAVGFDNEPLHGTNQGSVFDVGLVEVYGLVRQMDGRAV